VASYKAPNVIKERREEEKRDLNKRRSEGKKGWSRVHKGNFSDHKEIFSRKKRRRLK